MWGNYNGQVLNRDDDSFNAGDLTVFGFDVCDMDTYETIKSYLCTFQLAQSLLQKLK